jgi:hypothetical protein
MRNVPDFDTIPLAVLEHRDKLTHLLNWKTEVPASLDELQPPEITFHVMPMTTGGAHRGRKQADLFVVTNRRNVAAAFVGEGTDG